MDSIANTTAAAAAADAAADAAAWLAAAASVLSGAASALAAAAVLLARLAAWLVTRLALWPLRRLAAVLLVVLSPVTHTVRYALAPAVFLANSLPNLEPYYIYFGSAAFVGIIAGTCLQLASSTIVSLFGLGAGYEGAAAYVKPEAPEEQRLLDEHSSQESDWPWLEDQPGRRHTHHAPSYRRRGQTRGLLSQTILEEDDSE